MSQPLFINAALTLQDALDNWNDFNPSDRAEVNARERLIALAHELIELTEEDGVLNQIDCDN